MAEKMWTSLHAQNRRVFQAGGELIVINISLSVRALAVKSAGLANTGDGKDLW